MTAMPIPHQNVNMQTFQTFDATLLNNAGLLRQAVFNINELPPEVAASMREHCDPAVPCRQLILIGHAGRKLWECVKASGIDSPDPIDNFTVNTVRQWFAACQPHNRYDIIYPGTRPIGLQSLGKLAGWHHASPFMVGIDSEWGTWYAYRAAVVADTNFEPTKRIERTSPCSSCDHRICIASCPAGAMDEGQFDLKKCVAYRKQEESRCADTCVARTSCPVGREHRYTDEQIRHSYSISLRVLQRYY
jgi:hypothetical protein